MNSPSMNTKSPYSTSKGIRARLFIGFGTITLILIVAISIVLYKVTAAENLTNQVMNVGIPTQNDYYDVTMKMYQAQLALSYWVVTHDPNEKSVFFKLWNSIDTQIGSLDQSVKTDNTTEFLKKWQDTKSLYMQVKKENMALINATTVTPIELAQSAKTFNNFLDSVDGPLDVNGERVGGIFDLQYNKLKQNGNVVFTEMNSIRLIEYVLLGISAFISFLIAVYTSRGIIKYVNTFRTQSARIASGDLRHRVDILSNDEMGQLGNDLNLMTDSLVNITKQITEACHQMVTTIEEVKHAVDVQSSGATEQASSINQITSSLEEIEKSSSQTIEKAKTLGEVAELTQEKGQLGLKAVEESVLGMKSVRDKVETIAQTILDLSNQTQQVGEITSVVNTLAQQSKMLALNASIEAAKAGEAGKGFAVVASEVKTLAEQSEQSTSQVQKILEDIRRATEKAVMATEEGTKGVDQGTGLVEQTGDIVKSLSDVIHETTIASQQIQAAIRQEGIGIEQITAGMNEINQVTASFVDSVKQTTEAIGNLAEMVKNLKQYTDVYKL